MHRSGTSCIANELANAGVPISENLLPPDAGNAEGYFEDPRVIAIHDQILGSLGSNWMDPSPLPSDWLAQVCSNGHDDILKNYLGEFGQKLPVLLIKEPRISRLLALWLRVCEQCGHDVAILHVGRTPVEVAHSLWRRNHVPLAHGLQLWARYNLDIVNQSIGNASAKLDIRQFINDPGLLDTICEKFGITIADRSKFGSQTKPEMLQSGPIDAENWKLSNDLLESISSDVDFENMAYLKNIYDLCGGDMIAIERRHYSYIHSTLWTVVEELRQFKNSVTQ